MPTMSKDGVTMFDVPDTDEDVAGAKEKGYSEYLPMTKNGTDVFHVPATDEDYKGALAKGYQDVDAYKVTQPAKEALAKPSKNESLVRGGFHGASVGYLDELGGAVEAVGSALGVRGAGGSFGDIHKATPEEAKQSYGDIYRQARDKRRTQDATAEAANPTAYTVGDLSGSLASGAVLPGGATLKGAAAMGAVQGLGRSDADLTKGEVGGAALDTAEGGAAGIAGGLVAKALPVAGKVLSSPKTSYEALERGATAGAGEAGWQSVPGVSQVARLWGAIKGGLSELGEQGAVGKEVAGVADEARKGLAAEVKTPDPTVPPEARIKRLQELHAFGAGKSVDKLSDDEAILAALMDKGDNPTKKWVAEKAASLPGQVDQGDYAKVLGMGSEARTAARGFDPREAAAALKPTVQETQDLFEGARSARRGSLENAAKQSFDSAGADSVLGEVNGALEDAGKLHSVPGSVSGVLKDVKGMLEGGVGTRLQKLAPGEWGSADAAERFTRLQQSRQLLDQQLNWAKQEGLGQSENLLRQVRGAIDDALKTSPEKVESDALWKRSKDVEKKFFDATEFQHGVDESKIARLLGNTDQAVRFKASIGELEQFAADPDLAPEFQAKAKELITKLKSSIGTADDKRAINTLRQANGPSSPAIERVGSAVGGNDLVTDAVRSPAGFTNAADQFNQALKQRLGKGFEDLEGADKYNAIKFWKWQRSHPSAAKATEDAVFNKLFGGAQ